MNKYIMLIIFILVIFSCEIESSYPEADWTLMFYLGDDYSTLGLMDDVIELTTNIVNTSDIRVIILYDGPDDDEARLEILDNPLNLSSRIIPIETTTILVDEYNELDMANPATLKSYVNYTKKMLPANNYALYIGSHGTGFTNSYPSGLALENTGSTDSGFLTVSELSTSLIEAEGVDLIVFDACLMGNIETIYELSGATKYVIASPELIPGPGNDYLGFIEAAYSLDDLSVESLGKATLESHYNYYDININFQNSHEAKSLQQLYNVDKIVEISESLVFKSELLQFKQNIRYDTTTFDNGNYSDIFDLLSDKSIFDDAITIPVNGLYTWISIYIPEQDEFNKEYETTKFALDNQEWVELLKN